MTKILIVVICALGCVAVVVAGKKHGFQYINLDAGWNNGEDGYGRPLFDSATFPTFIDMIRHIHANGQKVGIYLNPGISKTAVQQNLPIYGTSYHAQDVVALPITGANVFDDADKIDYTKPGAQAWWHQATGYLPITKAAYELSQAQGFYDRNPGADISIKQITLHPPTENSKGLRLGSFVLIRDVIEDELEQAISGKTAPKAALDSAVRRGNEILRRFEKANP